MNNIKSSAVPSENNHIVKIKEAEVKPENEQVLANFMNPQQVTSENVEQTYKEPVQDRSFRAQTINSNINQTEGLVKAHFSFNEEKQDAIEQKVQENVGVNQVQNQNITPSVSASQILSPNTQPESINYNNKVTQETIKEALVKEEKPVIQEKVEPKVQTVQAMNSQVENQFLKVRKQHIQIKSKLKAIDNMKENTNILQLIY